MFNKAVEGAAIDLFFQNSLLGELFEEDVYDLVLDFKIPRDGEGGLLEVLHGHEHHIRLYLLHKFFLDLEDAELSLEHAEEAFREEQVPYVVDEVEVFLLFDVGGKYRDD